MPPSDFYPRPPRGGRLKNGGYETTREIISIHALREEGDASRPSQPSSLGDFYPRPPRGGRRGLTDELARPVYFYPRPPRGGRRGLQAHMDYAGEFLSTPSARRATQLEIFGEREYIISIHALREEGDPRSIMRLQVRYNFYPRPPRGGRPWPRSGSRWTSAFLSTPSARRATRSSAVVDGQRAISIHALREEGDTRTRSSSWSITNFYPRPPRGGRLATLKVVFKAIDISIHALREEGDPGCVCCGRALLLFLSTPSARRATGERRASTITISYFYPRPPRGGRPGISRWQL